MLRSSNRISSCPQQPRTHLLVTILHPHAHPHRRRTQQRGSSTQAAVFDKLKGFFSGSSSRSSDDDEEDGAEMVRIDPDSKGGLGGTSESVFGPLAVLLVGFLEPEYDAFRGLMNEMEADMVKVVPATPALMSGSLQAAMESEFPQFQQPPLGQRRAIIVSGMYGSEVTEVIAAYREAGLPPCAFAAAVPNNWQRNVQELVDAVWRDQAAMMSKQQQMAQKSTNRPEDSY